MGLIYPANDIIHSTKIILISRMFNLCKLYSKHSNPRVRTFSFKTLCNFKVLLFHF